MASLDGCVLEVDINKISQVIRNFLSNSLKFTSSHGSVTLRAYRIRWPDSSISHSHSKDSTSVLPEGLSEDSEGTVVRIEVIDTGPGLSAEDQRKLFHEAIQFNAADMQAGNGSGFGLYSESIYFLSLSLHLYLSLLTSLRSFPNHRGPSQGSNRSIIGTRKGIHILHRTGTLFH
jgi:signal transduction histidine kinase